MSQKIDQSKIKTENDETKFLRHSMQLRHHKNKAPDPSIKAETSSYFSSSNNDIKDPESLTNINQIKIPKYTSEKVRNHCKTMLIHKKAKKSSLQLAKENFSIKMKLYKFLKQQQRNNGRK